MGCNYPVFEDRARCVWRAGKQKGRREYTECVIGGLGQGKRYE